MILLVLGIVLFLGMHAFTMARGQRAALIARFGEGGYKGLYSLVSLVGLIAIIWGFASYRASGYIPVYDPPRFLRHVTHLFMLPVFVLFASVYLPGLIKAKAKHPMLAGVKLWAFAHLLSNGDLGSILLFVSFLAWAVVARIAAKKREEAMPGAPAAVAVAGWTQNDTIAVVVGLVLYGVFAFLLHMPLIGVSAFG